MSKLKTYPLRHLSIRVPWHDSGWNGAVCKDPKHNTACLKLTNIANRKDETVEAVNAGKSIADLALEQYPACVTERGTFMADFAFERLHEHPYFKTSQDTHGHFRPTTLRYPPFAAAGLPFRWMMKPVVFGDSKEERGLVKDFPLDDVCADHEPELPFKTHWVQDHRNHQFLLKCFWSHIKVEESLVFFYAKQVPLVEDTGRRVLIGAGRVLKIGGLTEYVYDGPPGDRLRSLLWENMVVHSIRPGFQDGFILPYAEALEKSDEGRNFDPAEVVAFAPDDRFNEFSFATEHVSNDAAISSLVSCRLALLRSAQLFDITIGPQEKWIDLQLGRLWKKRGPFPGLGSVLSATGVQMGNFIAQALFDKVGEKGNPWMAWNEAIASPDTHLPANLANYVDPIIAKSWQKMAPTRRRFLEMLSRIDLTYEQASHLAIPEERKRNGLDLDDSAYVENPYLLYESTRLTTVPLSIGAVDRGLFPTAFIRSHFPIPEPSTIKTSVDGRRLRALVIRELEQASARGDTLATRAETITAIRLGDDGTEKETADVNADLLAVAEESFAGEIRLVQMADGSPAYQLERLGATSDLIRTTVNKRVAAARHKLPVNWQAELTKQLGVLPAVGDDRVKEQRAREEKAAALQELAGARFSVLIGPAGTGKTTLLSVLCARPEINNDAILLLAPTGKARVRMEQKANEAAIPNFQAMTLAQFLSKSDPPRYEGVTQRYRLTGSPGQKGTRTVIVDECSMLTEEMMAALIEAVTGVHRLILAGDPRQLPPIGAGRPFADIVALLAPSDLESRFPRVGVGYAELTVPRRQGSGERADLQLAGWFGGGASGPGEDQVFEILSGVRKDETLQFVPWETPAQLEKLIPEVLAKTLGFDSKQEEWQAFACSLGGNLDDSGSAWFNSKYGKYDGSAYKIENWQILSPVRQQPWGVENINRLIHLRYKGHQIEQARNANKFPSIPPPRGESQIIYGDKVINNRNWFVPKGRLYPKSESRGYLANGEIGVVVGHRRTKKKSWKPENLEIEFSTQRGTVFSFYKSDFSDEGDARLDLAYALTVHKAQGSEFEVVFLVLQRSQLSLTRELLYTALTRQKKKVVIFHQGSVTDLQRLSSESFSATATRMTNLFAPPKRVLIGKTFLEASLIHLTTRGEPVRSKSEVIIANLLHGKGIDYRYEEPLEFEGVVKYPDFTIEDDDAGITYYWEHCGMLGDPGYKRRWEDKQKWYREHSIWPPGKGNGASKGTLIVTRDEPDGGIDSHGISKLIKTLFG